MPALEPVAAIRVVAIPAALDAAPLGRRRRRRPPDRARRGARDRGDRGRGRAIPTPSSSRRPASSWRSSTLELASARGAHAIGRSPTTPGALAQGKVAGVPAKLVVGRAAPCSSSRPRTRTSSSGGSDGDACRGGGRRSLQPIVWHEPRATYDVVIIGGGGHGLATAYYLATRHGITNVAVVEADYIASGNTGRNTTIIRSNYAVPEAIRFYDHSRQLYAGLEAETGAAIFHRVKGHVWIAHTEMALRTERGRVPDEPGVGRRDRAARPGRGQASSFPRST